MKLNSSEVFNINERIRFIQSNKFKEHMKNHIEDFIQPYDKLLNEAENILSNKGIKDNFIETVITFPNNIGYSYVNKIKNADNVIYAKRNGRDIYSKFELNREKILTNKCVIVLSKNKYRENEYYLITMFPGEYSIKEVQDSNIKTDKQRNESINFWKQNAFVFDKNLVQEETIISKCPY